MNKIPGRALVRNIQVRTSGGGCLYPWSHTSFNHGLLGAEIFSWVNETPLTPNYPLRLFLSLRMSVRCRIADITITTYRQQHLRTVAYMFLRLSGA